MEERKKSMELLCSFYVSDWHIVTMILPYINTQINNGVKVATILEKDLENKMFELLEKLNLKNKEKMKQIDWKIKNGYKYETIQQVLLEKTQQQQLILVCGSKDFLEKTNQNIQKWYQNQKVAKIKVVNCYEVTEFNCHIQEILDYHDKILNTSGEREICEIFDGYQKSIHEAN